MPLSKAELKAAQQEANAIYGHPSGTPKPPTPSAPAPTALGSHAAPPTPSENPFLPLLPVLTGAARAAGTGVGSIFSLLERPGAATQVGLLHGPLAGLAALIHEPTQQQIDANNRLVSDMMFGIVRNAAGKQIATLPLTDSGPGAYALRTILQHSPRGVRDFASSTITDPTSYVGYGGEFEHLAALATEHGFPLLARTIAALEHAALAAPEHASQFLREATALLNRVIQNTGHILGGLHDYVTFKGATKRTLAAAEPTLLNAAGRAPENAGLTQFAGVKSINTVMRGDTHDLYHSLLDEYHNTFAGLSPTEEHEMYQVIHTGQTANVAPKVLERVAAFKRLTNTLAHLQGGAPLQAALESGGYAMPEAFKRFVSDLPRDLQDETQYRPNYLPQAHGAAKAGKAAAVPGGIVSLDPRLTPSEERLDELLKEMGASAAPPSTAEGLGDTLAWPRDSDAHVSTTKGLDAVDKALLPREAPGRVLDTPLQRRVIEARLRSGARAITAHDAEQKVAELFKVPSWDKVPLAAREFFRETYTSPENRKWWQDLAAAFKAAIDLPKIGLFALPFRHGANVATLGVFADPSLAMTFGTTGKFARIMLAGVDPAVRLRILGEETPGALGAAKHVGAFVFGGTDPEVRRAVLGDAAKFGATSAPSLDRTSGGWLRHLTPKTALETAERHGWVKPGLSSGWLGVIPGIGDIYKLSTHALWTFQDAADATRFERVRTELINQGFDATAAAYRAAEQVGAELIDYSNHSPLTEVLSHIVPFSSFATKLPGAVMRLVVRHPERILAAGRISPELVGDEQQAPEHPAVPASGTSPAEAPYAQVGKSFLPVPKVLRGLGNPAEYARSSLGYPVSMAVSGALDMLALAAGRTAPRVTQYLTYGKAPDLKYLLNATLGSFPGGEAALGKAGLGEWFGQGSLSGAVRGSTGFGLSRAPSPSKMEHARIKHLYEQAIEAANKAGNTALSAYWQHKLDYYLETHTLYVK